MQQQQRYGRRQAGRSASGSRASAVTDTNNASGSGSDDAIVVTKPSKSAAQPSILPFKSTKPTRASIVAPKPKPRALVTKNANAASTSSAAVTKKTVTPSRRKSVSFDLRTTVKTPVVLESTPGGGHTRGAGTPLRSALARRHRDLEDVSAIAPIADDSSFFFGGPAGLGELANPSAPTLAPTLPAASIAPRPEASGHGRSDLSLPIPVLDTAEADVTARAISPAAMAKVTARPQHSERFVNVSASPSSAPSPLVPSSPPPATVRRESNGSDMDLDESSLEASARAPVSVSSRSSAFDTSGESSGQSMSLVGSSLEQTATLHEGAQQAPADGLVNQASPPPDAKDPPSSEEDDLAVLIRESRALDIRTLPRPQPSRRPPAHQPHKLTFEVVDSPVQAAGNDDSSDPIAI